jgi:hypothetical protein
VSNVEDTNNLPDLSEFFSVLSKEKKETRQKLKEQISNPESGLSNLFQQLEEVHKETQKVSEEIPDNKTLPIRGLSPDDQNKLEAFSSLMNSVDISLQESQEETPEIIEPPIAVEVFNNNSEKETDKLEAFSKLFGELAKVEEKQEPQKELVIEKQEPQKELVIEGEVSDAVSVLSGKLNLIPEDINELTKPQIVAQETNDIISDVISNLDVMEAKTKVKKEVNQITSIRAEFEKFKTHIQQHISNQGFSGGGSGETQLKYLDDVSTTGQEDGDVLTYNSSTGKYELKSSTSTASSLLDQDGSNVVLNATDSSGTSEGDDILLEIGVGGSKDVEQSILQELTSNIIPKHGGTIDLGSPTKRFKNIYLEADTIDLDGATIKSDGSGEISISADGATFPVGSKDATGKVLLAATSISETSGALTLQVPRSVPLFTQASGLSTAAINLTFSAIIKNRSVYTNSGHTFLLSNGSDRTDASVELFEF